MAQKQVEGPGERRRRGLVAGEQQGHQLVAQLGVAHRLAVLEAGGDEHREDVLAACEVRVGAPLGDLGGQQLVDLGHAALQRGERVGPAEAPGEQDPKLKPRRGGLGEQVGEQRPEPRDARWVADAEDGAQDHLERQRLHARVDREGLAGGPGVDLAGGELRDDPLVGAHPLAVEGREHQPPPREVLVALEQQDRARPQHGLEGGAAPRGQAVLAPPVERSDRLGVRHHHHRRLEAEEGDAEGVAVPAPARVHELDRAKQPVEGLDGRRAPLVRAEASRSCPRRVRRSARRPARAAARTG